MTLADSGWSQCFVETFLIKEAQCGQVYGLYISSGDSRVVVSVFVLCGAVLDIKEAHFSESIYDNKKTRRGWLVQFSAIKE